MLFNSLEFLFLFLPIGWGVYYWLYNRFRVNAPFVWLAAISLFYYGWWSPKYLLLLIGSKGFNYLIGKLLFRLPKKHGKPILIFALIANLALLIYFKYTAFIVQNINAIASTQIPIPHIILPLAISFFTFQQIAYVVDVYQGKVPKHGFLEYLLFVTFFPQLIAGPIVHHNEMMPQFAHRLNKDTWRTNVETGLTLLIMGLFKKSVLADSLSPLVSPVFNAADANQVFTGLEAWTAALAYTFQLYFDFSGYSDMALGAACMFGIRLPVNFYSPYKSTCIIEFWRRWHMTLSRFLRDYVYIPLGGSRLSSKRRYLNLMVTMLIGGLWHGAAWNFLIWGGLHGGYLMLNHGWRALIQHRSFSRAAQFPTKVWAQSLTFLAVVIAWVFFRAESLHAAKNILMKMFSPHLDSYSQEYLHAVETLNAAKWISLFGSTSLFPYVAPSLLILCAAITFFMPNSIQLVPNFQPTSYIYQEHSEHRTVRMQWRPTTSWAVFLAILAFMSILGLRGVSEFIYYQF
jgi:D-alanyl-lipoteichoic acid acyltransferase DltB (MBOAT superfamily)